MTTRACKHIAYVATLAISSLTFRAQTPPPPPPTTGPTMEQTVAFINDALQKRGRVEWTYPGYTSPTTEVSSSIELTPPCTLTIRTRGIVGDERRTLLGKNSLDLEHTDPRSVRVDTPNTKPPAYLVYADNAVYEGLPPDNPTPATHPPKASQGGSVYSVSLPTFVLLSDEDNTLITYTFNKKTLFVTMDDKMLMHTHAPGELKAGDNISVSAGKSKDNVTEAQQISMSTDYTPLGKKKGSFVPAAFLDRDTAERVSKAFIHALVLCHKAEAPSLF